jgi:hypothetical protein
MMDTLTHIIDVAQNLTISQEPFLREEDRCMLVAENQVLRNGYTKKHTKLSSLAFSGGSSLEGTPMPLNASVMPILLIIVSYSIG